MLCMTERRVPPGVDELVAELAGIFRERLRMVAVYGDAVHLTGDTAGHEHDVHTLAIVEALSPAELSACATLAAAWHRRRLATPLLLTSDELQRSLDAFPLEFSQILADHVVVHGPDALAGLAVKEADVRRACESQARSHALHLRESYLEAAAEPRQLARIVTASSAPFRALVASVARLHGDRGPFDVAAINRVAARADLNASAIRQVLDAARTPMAAADAEAFFPTYLELAERLVRHVDAWRA
jgi:hypothetical protein